MLAEAKCTEGQLGAAILRCVSESRKVTWVQFLALVGDAASRQPAAAAAE